jgi:hypothetical protein
MVLSVCFHGGDLFEGTIVWLFLFIPLLIIFLPLIIFCLLVKLTESVKNKKEIDKNQLLNDKAEN